jgi:hypothetical protein
MATQLNLKDPVLIQRVRDLARRKNKSVTAALRDLVDEEWTAQQAEASDRLARMMAFTRELQAQVPEELRTLTSKEIMNSIYDEKEPDGFAR